MGTKHLLLLAINFIVVCINAQQINKISSLQKAEKYSIIHEGPAVDFFEGALLGNGGMGVVIRTTPDAIILHFGHNNIWDIRISEQHRSEIGKFKDVFMKVNKIPDTLSDLYQDPWYAQYNAICTDNYSKPYPRPFPCGTVLLAFDRRDAEVIGYRLDISNGLCEVEFRRYGGKHVFLQIFTEMQQDKLWMRLVDEKSNMVLNFFNRIKLIPDPSTPIDFPKYRAMEDIKNGIISFRQILPYQEPNKYDTLKGHPDDKAFRLMAMTNTSLLKRSNINWNGNIKTLKLLEGRIPTAGDFIACISLQEGLNSAPDTNITKTIKPSTKLFSEAFKYNLSIWKAYWIKSGVDLSDPFLEGIWYRNLYFFNCATKGEAACPGLFANWSYNQIGTAWHEVVPNLVEIPLKKRGFKKFNNLE